MNVRKKRLYSYVLAYARSFVADAAAGKLKAGNETRG